MRLRFWAVLALILVAAAGLRVAYVLTVTQFDDHFYDATYYELQARGIVHGEGFFKDPFAPILHPGTEAPQAADHPPLTVFTLLPAAAIDDEHDSKLAMRFTMVLLGLGSVVLIGLLGRELGGDGVGLVAAGIAAVDPNLWINDGLIMSEAVSVLVTVGLLLLAYRVMRGASVGRVAALAVLCALAVLVRAELVLLTPLVALPAVWIGTPGETRPRVLRVVACGAGAALLVMPWVGYNLARFERPTLISTNDGYALLSANCGPSYTGRGLGFIDPYCVPPATPEQSVTNARNRSEGLHFVRTHLGRLPTVVLARLGRMWSVFRVRETAGFNVGEGRPRWATYAATLALYALVAFAVYGGIVLRRRRVRIWPLLVPIVVVTVSIVLWTGGMPRYRAPAEPSIIVFAAVGIVMITTRARHRTDDASTTTPDTRVEPVAR